MCVSTCVSAYVCLPVCTGVVACVGLRTRVLACGRVPVHVGLRIHVRVLTCIFIGRWVCLSGVSWGSPRHLRPPREAGDTLGPPPSGNRNPQHQVSPPPTARDTPRELPGGLRPHNLCPCAGCAGEWKGGHTVLCPGLPLGSQPNWEGPPRPCWGFGKGEGKLSPRLLGWGWGRWSGRKRSGLLGPVGKSRG